MRHCGMSDVQQIGHRGEELAQRENIAIVEVQQLDELRVDLVRRNAATNLLEEATVVVRNGGCVLLVRLRILPTTRSRHEGTCGGRSSGSPHARIGAATTRGRIIGVDVRWGQSGWLVAGKGSAGQILVHLVDHHRRFVLVFVGDEHQETLDEIIMAAEQFCDLRMKSAANEDLLNDPLDVLTTLLVFLQYLHEPGVGVISFLGKALVDT